MVRSSRSRAAACAAVVLASAAMLSAHRRDEYLQAARLAIDPDRVEVQLDLTPGIAVADRLIAEVDRNRDGVVSDAEARVYAGSVQHDLHVDLDGRALPLTFIDSHPAEPSAMAEGTGTLQLHWNVPLPPIPAGAHRLTFTNGHHNDIGVYLANVLVPSSNRIAVTAQQRDADQRQLTVTYEVKGERSAHWSGALLAVLGGAVAAAAVLRRSARPSRT